MPVLLEEPTTVADALPYITYCVGLCLDRPDDEFISVGELLNSLRHNYGNPYGTYNSGVDDEALIPLCEIALLELRRCDLIEVIEDQFADLFVLAGNGISQKITLQPNLAQIHRKYVKGGYRWLANAVRGISIRIQPPAAQAYLLEANGGEPAQPVTNARSDDWEPLPIDRTSVEYKEAVEASEAALREIETSNGYAASAPEERNSIVETIKGNIAALKFGFPSRRSILEGLLRPFQFISKKFAEASIGEAAKIAVVKLGSSGNRVGDFEGS
jgi:hypothetical protein